MKYVVVFLVVCVALAAAAPQLLWPGYTGGVVAPWGRTIVAGPSVVNPLTGVTTLGGRIVTPGGLWGTGLTYI